MILWCSAVLYALPEAAESGQVSDARQQLVNYGAASGMYWTTTKIAALLIAQCASYLPFCDSLHQ